MVTATTTSDRLDSLRGYRLDQAHELQELIKNSVHNHLLTGVDVEVQEQSVVLIGHVGSWYEKQLAQETVRSLVPQQRIYNRLKVAFS